MDDKPTSGERPEMTYIHVHFRSQLPEGRHLPYSTYTVTVNVRDEIANDWAAGKATGVYPMADDDHAIGLKHSDRLMLRFADITHID